MNHESNQKLEADSAETLQVSNYIVRYGITTFVNLILPCRQVERYVSTELQSAVLFNSSFGNLNSSPITMERQVSYLSYGNHGAPLSYGNHGVPLSMETKWFSKCTEYEGGNIGDTFRVDDLLDFSNEEIAGITSEDSAKDGLQLSNQSADSSATVAEKVSGDLAKDSAQPSCTLDEDEITTDLCVRCEDIAELEWLSTFVEDSFSGAADFKVLGSLCATYQKCTEQNTKKDDSSSGSESVSNLSHDISVPGRARSKRLRAGERVWSSRMLTSATCSGFQTATASFLSFDGPVLSAETEFIATTELLCGTGPFPARKIAKFCKRKVWQDGSQPRRCTHCLTQRTPQWRAGPMGPKTLCNACGVRFKSGRLLPEYRPAGSPTFLSHKHSNSHRKVLDMRRQKGTSGPQEGRPSDEEVSLPLRHPLVLELEGQLPSLHHACFRKKHEKPNSEECTEKKGRA